MTRWFTALALAFGLATLAACGDTAPPKGSVFVWGKSSDASRLDPATVTDGESVMVTTNIFDNLVAFEPGSAKLIPWLATEWSTSDDGLIWTFTLRAEVTFHDGSPFDAEAVVFSFERQKDPNHPAHVGDFAYYADNFKSLQTIEAIDAHTVRFTLSRPYQPFLSALALFSAAIVSPAAWKSEGIDESTGRYRYDFSERPVGTGPFVFQKWEKDARIVLTANPDHFAGKPAIERLVFKPIEKAQARLQELIAGSIHGMDNPDPADLERAEAHGDLRVVRQPGINTGYLAMNTMKKPFDDVRVRQAIAYAIDKARIIEAAYEGRAVPAVTMCPVGMPGHVDIEDRKPDLDRARALLAEAGHPDGFATKLSYGTAQRTYMPNPPNVAIQIQADLARIGIEVELEKVEWSAYIPATKRGDHEMCLLGWMADILDPDNFLYVLLDKENARPGSANNVSFYRDEQVHEWLMAAQRSGDEAERADLYAKVQRRVFEQCPVVPIAQAPDVRILRRGIAGYRIYPVGGEYFREVRFE